MLRTIQRVARWSGLPGLSRAPWALGSVARDPIARTPRACYSTDPDMPDLVDMSQQPKDANMFPKEEFDRRVATLRKHMADEGIGGTLFTSYHNINYFTGFVYCYFGRPYGLVVTPDETIVLSAGIDATQPWRRSAASRAITYTDWQRDNFWRAVKQLLSNAGGKIGCEYDHISVENKDKLELATPGLPKVDVGAPTMNMRIMKSPEEHRVIREGARICDVGGRAIVDALAAGGEGTPEYEVALAGTQAMVREIARAFPMTDIMDTWVWFQSGAVNTDGAHNPVTTRGVQKGDILSLNTFPMIQGYYTALERTLFFDDVNAASLKVWEHNVKVHERGIELLKPGARCCDVAKELNELFREADLLKYRSFGYGHSFGTLSHYYGREAGLELREDIETVLEPGMVVSMEPMVTLPPDHPAAGGYREHDILLITETGNENLTGFPYGPEHNVVKAR